VPTLGLATAGPAPSGPDSPRRSMLRSSSTVFRVIRIPVTRRTTRKATPQAARSSTASVSATHKNAPHKPPGAPAAFSPYA
jgi:hypothetical protein